MNELTIPPEAIDDLNSFEILRVWAANEKQHVTINSSLNGNSYDFGYMLAQLAIHASKLYSEKTNQSESDMLKDILLGFNDELKNNTGEPTGSMF